MTRQEFKSRWEKDDNGDGITCDEIAECAKKWGISSLPKTRPINEIVDLVLKEAGIGEEYGIPNVSERPKLTAEEESTTKRK